MMNTTDNRNFLERLIERIPGYGGYAAKEARRDADKLHREHLADELRSLKTSLNDAVRQLADGGRLLEIAPLDRVGKKLDRIENRVRFAAYGYTGFFDAVKIKEAQLDLLYRFDLRLAERAAELRTQLNELNESIGAAETLRAVIAGVERAIDDFDRTFDERRQMIDGYGGASSDEPTQPPPSFLG